MLLSFLASKTVDSGGYSKGHLCPAPVVFAPCPSEWVIPPGNCLLLMRIVSDCCV